MGCQQCWAQRARSRSRSAHRVPRWGCPQQHLPAAGPPEPAGVRLPPHAPGLPAPSARSPCAWPSQRRPDASAQPRSGRCPQPALQSPAAGSPVAAQRAPAAVAPPTAALAAAQAFAGAPPWCGRSGRPGRCTRPCSTGSCRALCAASLATPAAASCRGRNGNWPPSCRRLGCGICTSSSARIPESARSGRSGRPRPRAQGSRRGASGAASGFGRAGSATAAATELPGGLVPRRAQPAAGSQGDPAKQPPRSTTA
mmetsp:Transcript_93400/g.290650  ORF Transcript_93400/g.290650 Transcript_93400/m.290650 type:complete len:255 (-) Transcript_93400:7-771(-)